MHPLQPVVGTPSSGSKCVCSCIPTPRPDCRQIAGHCQRLCSACENSSVTYLQVISASRDVVRGLLAFAGQDCHLLVCVNVQNERTLDSNHSCRGGRACLVRNTSMLLRLCLCRPTRDSSQCITDIAVDSASLLASVLVAAAVSVVVLLLLLLRCRCYHFFNFCTVAVFHRRPGAALAKPARGRAQAQPGRSF